MMKQHSYWHEHLPALVALWLSLALSAHAQPRTGGGVSGGGFSGGGFGGTTRTTTGTTGGSTSRQYPNNTTIGDAYFSIDPETRRVVYIADEATARKASRGGVVEFQVLPPSGEMIMPEGEPRRSALAPATRVPSAEQATAAQLADGERVGFQLPPELVEQ